MAAERWPARWQPEAIEAVEPYVDSEYLVYIWVGDPATSISGTLIAGYIYNNDDGDLELFYDQYRDKYAYRSPLLMGPVLYVKTRLPGKQSSVIFRHPDWPPKRA